MARPIVFKKGELVWVLYDEVWYAEYFVKNEDGKIIATDSERSDNNLDYFRIYEDIRKLNNCPLDKFKEIRENK